MFTEIRRSLTGADTCVELPSETVDREVELALDIGRTADRIQESRAWDHVAGVTVAQDLSERTLQLAGPAPQFSLTKSYPGSLPLGPSWSPPTNSPTATRSG